MFKVGDYVKLKEDYGMLSPNYWRIVKIKEFLNFEMNSLNNLVIRKYQERIKQRKYFVHKEFSDNLILLSPPEIAKMRIKNERR